MGYQFSDDEWIEVVKTEYTVNNGKRVSSVQYDYNRGEIQKSLETTYDEYEKPICTIDVRHNRKYDYVNDNKGNAITQISSFLYDGNWETERKNDFTYDEVCNILTIAYYDYEDGQWGQTYFCSY